MTNTWWPGVTKRTDKLLADAEAERLANSRAAGGRAARDRRQHPHQEMTAAEWDTVIVRLKALLDKIDRTDPQ